MRERENKGDKDVKPSRELTQTQKEDLNNILDKIDKNVNETVHIINRIKSIKKYGNVEFIYENYVKRITQVFVLVLYMVITLVYCGYFMEIANFNKDYKESFCDSTQTKINIYMNNESKMIEYDLISASIHNKNNMYTEIDNIDWIKSDVDTDYEVYNIDGNEFILEKRLRLKSLIVNENYVYIEYANKDKNANKEILLCYEKPLDIHTNDIQKKTLRFFEKSNPIMIKSYTNSFNDSFLMINEAIGGGELNINTLEKEINNVENNIKTSEKYDGLFLKIDELGSINVKDLNNFFKSPEIIYNSADRVLRIQEKNNDKTFLYIFDIYNEKIGIRPEDLLETNIDNIFIHKQFDDESSNGFNTFVIITNNNIYCFKTSNRDLVLEILDTLKFDSNLLTINKIQSVIRKQE